MNETNRELYNAARFGDARKVRELLKIPGVNINYQGASGRTSLHLAAQKGHYDVLGVLLRRGADPSIKNMKGLTAQEYAEKDECRDLFYKYAPTPENTP